MIPTAPDSHSLLNIIIDSGLYKSLVHQLQKDFQLSGLSIQLLDATRPEALYQNLLVDLEKLITHNFDGYMQLLYRVDIAEESMQIDGVQSVAALAKKATYKILQREWQKVYFRNKFG